MINRASKKLGKLLEECNLNYLMHYFNMSWRVGPKLYNAVDNLNGTLTVDNLTPEQAIAATLKSGKCKLDCLGDESFSDATREGDGLMHLCEGCEHFSMVPEMGAHLPWCKLYMRYYPKRCDRFEHVPPSKGHEGGEVMSMFSLQANELRGYAMSVQNIAINATNLDNGARRDLLDGALCMNKAADTIESMRDKLQELQGATLGSNNTKECENLLWELVGALDVADATDVSEKPIITEYARRITATLGGGECKLVEVDSYINDREETIYVFECSVCGETCEHVNGIYPKCPHCGAKVVIR